MLDQELLYQLQDYVSRHQIPPIQFSISESPRNMENEHYSIMPASELENFVKNFRQPTFSEVLFKLIDRKGVTDADIYKKAGLDRRHFSKIRSNSEYRPGKSTVIALAFALELNKTKTEELLKASGYSLSQSETFDLVIRFCLEKKIYNLDEVNQALDYFSLKPLAGVVE